jgi:Tfp pilus assembly protein PilF
LREHIRINEASRLASVDASEAEVAFKNAVETEDESGTASYYYGKFLFDQSRFAEALPILKNAKVRSGPHAATSLLIAKCQFHLGELNDCRAELSEILVRYPQHGGALKLLNTLESS